MRSNEKIDVAARTRAWSRTIRRAAVVAAIGLLAARALPPHGIDAPVCAVRAISGVPCPGCGLTRAASCAVRGMLCESVGHHPFGLALVGAGIVVLGLCLVPDARRRAWIAPFAARAGLVRVVFVVAAGASLAFGVVRAWFHAAPG